MRKNIWPFCRESMIAILCIGVFSAFVLKNVKIEMNSSYRLLLYFCVALIVIIGLVFLKKTLSGIIALIDLIFKNTRLFKGEIIEVIPKESSWFSDRFDKSGNIITNIYFVVIVRDCKGSMLRLKSANYLEKGLYELYVSKHSSIIICANKS